VFLNCTIRAVRLSSPSCSTTPPRVSLSVCLFHSVLPPPLSPPSLRAGPLQHAQVIVLFGGPQFEEAGSAVVKFEGSTLGGHGAGEHGHDSVEVSRVDSLPPHAGPEPGGGPGPCRPPPGTGATAPSPASLGLLQPLDLGTAHGQLVEELLSLWSGDPLRQVRHLQDSTHHCRETGDVRVFTSNT